MKKSIFIIFIILSVTNIILFSRSITVTSPIARDNWVKGSTHNITWTSSGLPVSENLKINIFKNSVDPANFVEQFSSTNDHTESWTIGMGYATGNYIIRIKTADNRFYGDSQVFKISNRVIPVASLAITSPVSSTYWEIGRGYDITWGSTGLSASESLKINIFKNSVDSSNFIEQLASTNDGTEHFNIGSGYTPGNYIIRIKTADNRVNDDSDVFRIISPMISREIPHVQISSPSLNNRWCKNHSYTVRWDATGIGSSNMAIILINASTMTQVKTISSNTPNDGSFPITTSTFNDVTPGGYIIRVKTTDDSAMADSNRFQIADCSSDLRLSNVINYSAPSIISNSAELSIEEVTRTDSKPVKLGEMLGFSVRVKNAGSASANICIATPSPDRTLNFYKKGSCGTINGVSTKSYAIVIPVTRTLIKSALFKTTVFLIKSDSRGTLGTVLWKDGNSRNNFKTISLTASLPDLIVKEIAEVKYGHTSYGWQWTIVKVKVKNQGNYPSQPCKIFLQGYPSDPKHNASLPCNSLGRKIMDVPSIPPGKTITGFLPLACSQLGNPRNKFDIEIVVNPQNLLRTIGVIIKESNHNNNKLRVNITRLNAIRDDSSAPSTWDAWWLTGKK